MDDNSNQQFHEEYSSRIKKIYIQLHDYQYYHSPYEESHGDKRFIGRERILDKLKSLFSNAEYQTGAYLITGYRGSGKTSLVNKAISDLENKHKFLYGNPIGYILILFGYCIFSFFIIPGLQQFITVHKILGPILTGFIATFILLLWWFIAQSLIKNTLVKKNLTWWPAKKRVLRMLKRIFIVRDLSFQEKKYYTSYLPWYSMLLFPCFIALWIFLIFPENDQYYFMRVLCLNYSLLLLINLLHNVGITFYTIEKIILTLFFKLKNGGKNSAQRINKKNEKHFVFKPITTESIRSFIKGFFSFRSTIFIKLNLGHSRLREVDILKLLARNLKAELIKYYRLKTFIRIMVSLLIFYFFYTLTYLVYYQPTVYYVHKKIKGNIGLTEYFPSQKPYNLDQPVALIMGGKKTNIGKDILRRKIDSVAKIQVWQMYDASNTALTMLIQGDKSQALINFQHKTLFEFLWEKLSNAVTIAAVMIDAYLYIFYFFARKIIFNGILFFVYWLGPDPLSDFHPAGYEFHFTLIPDHLDYFFFAYILLSYFLFRRFLIGRLFNTKSPKNIIKKINDLNDIIVSEVTVDKATFPMEHESFNLFSFLTPRTKKRGVADVREIEKYLIEILDDINQIRFPYSCPDVVVVFDELDKIETHTYNMSRMAEDKKEMESGLQKLLKHPNPSFTIDGTRERQQTLQILLSNLKYFLSDANAKFIFIAGREMYDASLADISDRNYFMGSIFHDVINVSSFLSDKTDRKPSDITSMIEKYVCQFIIHPVYIDAELEHLQFEDAKHERIDLFTLQTFNKFLIDSFGDVFDENRHEYVSAKIIARQKREKIINTIQHFIIYLTHASNGAPKKVTNYFENFIEFLSLDTGDDNSVNCSKQVHRPQLVITLYEPERTKNRQNPYLIFNYLNQHEIGIINYITLPIILSISNHIKNYGDKLLVSATFLFDHLLKFHRDGFSWRQIEYIPEILEINRTPELRGFISDVLNHLLQTHLQVILSGLYSYRFNLRLSNEISYLSRISEEASASFNFTLDESLAIKHYYHTLLERLEERYQKISAERTQYIHSIAMVHTILGDLYFYDEEYNDAILEYMDSVQVLRYKGLNEENFALLLILIRNMLRLGLAFEKRKTFSSAYETYNELCYLLIKYRDIKLEEIGLYEKTDPVTNETVLAIPSRQEMNNWVMGVRHSNPEQTFYDVFPSENLMFTDNDIFVRKHEFINRLTEELNPLFEKIIGKISSFEGLRIIYQPLLARTQIMEKSILGGICPTDIFRVEKEFAFLQKAINQDEKFLIKVEFYNKLGDILFFKTGNVETNWKLKPPLNTTSKLSHNVGLGVNNQNKPNPNNCVHCQSVGLDTPNDSLVKHRDSTIFNLLGTSESSNIEGPEMKCAGCKFYLYSLRLFVWNNIDKTKKLNDLQSIKDIFHLLEENYPKLFSLTHSSLRILAGLISDIADAQFACVNFNFSNISINHLRDFVDKIKPAPGTQHLYDFSLVSILRQYYFSAKMYKKANDMKGYVWQLTKILYVIKEYFQNQSFDNLFANTSNYTERTNALEKLLTDIEVKIVRKAIRGCWSSYENAHMNEVSKQKKNISPDINNLLIASLNRSSVNSDVEEINLLFSEIKMLVWDLKFPKQPGNFTTVSQGVLVLSGLIPELYLKNMVSPYSETDTIINRLTRLNFKVKLNYRLLRQLILCILNQDITESMPFDKAKIADRNSWPEIERTSYWYIEYLTIIANLLSKGWFDKKAQLKSNIKVPVAGVGISPGSMFKEVSVIELFCHLVADSMYCLNEIIEISNAYGRSYILNNSFIGSAHEKMVFWSIWYIGIGGFKTLSASDKLKIPSNISIGRLNDACSILNETLNKYLHAWMDQDALESHSIVYLDITL